MASTSHLSRFGLTAVKAADLALTGLHPSDAWRSVAVTVFPDSPSSQVKGCPKSTFLGLAEDGYIVGIAPGRYTTSVDNKSYAIDALRLLQANDSLADNPRELWRHVLRGQSKVHNNQMNVVAALWRAQKFVCQNRDR